jgi:tetratricopeptide (TPR) repeat protein
VQRHRRPIAAAAAIAATLVLGIVLTAWQAIRASTALNEKTQALQESQEALNKASIMANLVLGEFLNSAQGSSYHPDTTVREAILRVVDRIDSEDLQDPELEAWIRHNLAGYFFRIGDYISARNNYVRALGIRKDQFGEDADETFNTAEQLHDLYSQMGESEKAVELAKSLAEARSRVLGEEHEKAVEARWILGGSLYRAKRYQEAEDILRQTIEDAGRLRQGYTEAAATTDLGNVYFDTERDEEAERCWKAALEKWRTMYGIDHPSTLPAMENLAKVYLRRGNLDEARKSLNTILARMEADYGVDHPQTSRTLRSLAQLHFRLGEYATSADFSRRVLAIQRRLYGDGHEATVDALYDLATATGHVDTRESRRLIEEALQIAQRTLGDRHPKTLRCLNSLGICARDLQDYDTAIQCYRDIIETRGALREADPDDNYNTLMLGGAYCNLGTVYTARQDNTQAVEHFSSAIDVLEPLYRSSSLFNARRFLGFSYENRALARRYLGQHEQSLADSERALTLADSDQQKARLELNRAKTVAAQGQYTQALRDAAATFAGFEEDGEIAYEMAGLYAIAAARSVDDPSASADARDERTREYEDKCFETLQLAQRLGYFDLTRSQLAFRSEPDFTAIRRDPRYRSFVESLDPESRDSGK